MAINLTRYVNITSGVGGGTGVRQRDLILRSFTTNPLLPTGSFAEFDDAADVADYFGASSEEAVRANFYFGYVSKNISKPNKIAFARWADAATAPLIYGKKAVYSLATLQAITTGQITVSMGGVDLALTGIDFSAASSLADVATIMQTAVRTGVGAIFTAATVDYDATRQSFNLTGGATGAAEISVTAGVVNDVAAAIGWLTDAIFSDGADQETPLESFIASSEANDNFASFLFQDALTIEQITALAEYNDTLNNKFMYSVPVLDVNASSYSTALIALSGVTCTISETSGEYPEMAPCAELAATDYSRRNSVVNYMFKQFPLTPSVTTDAKANTYDNLRMNYYGRTQTAGQMIDFYQRGVMMGASTDAVDQNVYANEIWLKDLAASNIMSLLLSVGRVSANRTGSAQIQTVLQQGVIVAALFNGTISVGRALTVQQKIFIDNFTGDENAWRQIQDIGYWLGVTFEPSTTQDGRTEWTAIYTLIYAKDDAIRKVDGTHVLI